MSSDSLKTKSAHFINRLLHGIKPNDKGELADMIKDASDRDIIDDDTESMLSGVFEISKRRLCDIMIPRSQMITIDSNSSIEDAVKIIAKHGHSRYPVICEDKDHIIGILLAKDLLPYAISSEKNKPTVDKLVHPLVIVPEFKRVDSMLKEFQENRFHMAVVVDEFGGVCGLVTIEDILEIIVGDIGDEYDDEEDTLTDDIIKSADDEQFMSFGPQFHLPEHPVRDMGEFGVAGRKVAADQYGVASDLFEEPFAGKAGGHQRVQVKYDAFIETVLRDPAVEQAAFDKDDIPLFGEKFLFADRHEEFAF